MGFSCENFIKNKVLRWCWQYIFSFSLSIPRKEYMTASGERIYAETITIRYKIINDRREST